MVVVGVRPETPQDVMLIQYKGSPLTMDKWVLAMLMAAEGFAAEGIDVTTMPIAFATTGATPFSVGKVLEENGEEMRVFLISLGHEEKEDQSE